MSPLPLAPASGGAGAGWTPSETSVTTSPASEADSPAARPYRTTDAARPPFPSLMRVYDGVGLAGKGSAGVFVDEWGERTTAKTRPPVPIAALLPEVSEEHRAAFEASGRRLYRTGLVPAPVVAQWRSLIADSGWTTGGAWQAAHSLAYAADQDAEDLRDKARETCGAYTVEYRCRFTDEAGEVRESRSWRRLWCRSHREPHCAKVLGNREKDRLLAQMDRDREAGRPEWVFMTVTVDRTRYAEGQAGEVEAMMDLLVRLRAYVRLLRRRYCEVEETTGPTGRIRRKRVSDLAYWYCVEFHTKGWPHVHLALRSRWLNEALLADA